LNNQTFAVKTNEEYRALLNEIDYLKKANKNVEDEMMNLLEEEEKLKSTIGKIETESNEFVNKKVSEISELRKNREELTEKLEKIKTDFEEYFNKLPYNVRDLYDKIKKVRGNAVCLIDNEICTGCYTNLTPQFFNELKKKNDILLCGNCGRILIYAVSNE
jgi:predicted  nucleic acid-binding Zn-ribbon protein